MQDRPDAPDKVDVTPQEVAKAFIQYVLSSNKSYLEAHEAYATALTSYSEFDQKTISYETMLLVGWVNEIVTWHVFRNDPTSRDAILATYYAFLDALAQKDDDWKAFDRELRKRVALYAEVVNKLSGQEQTEGIGVVFARVCGHPDDYFFVITGTINFSAAYARQVEFLSRVNITM